MYAIDYKNVKKGGLFHNIFIAIGVIFLIFFLFFIFYSIQSGKRMDSETISNKVEIATKKDSDGNRMNYAIYHYEVENKEYTCSASVLTSGKPSTVNTVVYYNSQDPQDCMTVDQKNINVLLIPLLLFPLVFITVGIRGKIKIHKRIKEMQYLSNHGKLIKNLPYRIEDTNLKVNGTPIKRPVVDYQLPSGVVIPLYGDERNDGKLFDEDGFVDLLIDENNPNLYYIDFEIKPITSDNNEK